MTPFVGSAVARPGLFKHVKASVKNAVVKSRSKCLVCFPVCAVQAQLSEGLGKPLLLGVSVVCDWPLDVVFTCELEVSLRLQACFCHSVNCLLLCIVNGGDDCVVVIKRSASLVQHKSNANQWINLEVLTQCIYILMCHVQTNPIVQCSYPWSPLHVAVQDHAHTGQSELLSLNVDQNQYLMKT
jgi:hypothetical protein